MLWLLSVVAGVTVLVSLACRRPRGYDNFGLGQGRREVVRDLFLVQAPRWPEEVPDREDAVTGRRASCRSRVLRASIVLAAVALPGPVWAEAIDFGGTWQLQIVNMIATQQFSMGTLTIATPTPDRLTWTDGDGFGVTGPSETTWDARTPGQAYEWDEVEAGQSLSLVWPEPVYVDALGLSNFFGGEVRNATAYEERATLWLDGAPVPLLANRADGFLNLLDIGWVQTLTLTAPGLLAWQDHDVTLRSIAWQDHDLSLQSVAWHEPPAKPVPAPPRVFLLAIGLCLYQLWLQRVAG